MAADCKGLDSLPNELLFQIFLQFPTRKLLHFASVSHRFYDLIFVILYHRLLEAASSEEHRLVLDCCHPSAKFTTRGIKCDYLGTDDLNNAIESDKDSSGLSKLAGLYSHFKPVGPARPRQPRRWPNLGPNVADQQSGEEEQVPSEVVSLESHELFSQLCSVANIVKSVPNGLFLLSCITLGEGVIRVWRDWLAERAMFQLDEAVEYANASSNGTYRCISADERGRILWLDHGHNVGIRLRVTKLVDAGPPIMRLGDDPFVSYNIEYEEIIVRTNQVLLKVEESLEREASDLSNVILVGSLQPMP